MKLKTILMLLVPVFFVVIGGCTSNTYNYINGASDYPYPGTDTVFVGVFVNEKGEVEQTTKREIVHPGQKIIFSSAYEFKIKFKGGKSPVKKPVLNSSNGVVIVKIPKGIFKQDEFFEEFKKRRELVFDYEIQVGDKSLDPPMIVRPK